MTGSRQGPKRTIIGEITSWDDTTLSVKLYVAMQPVTSLSLIEGTLKEPILWSSLSQQERADILNSVGRLAGVWPVTSCWTVLNAGT